MSTSPAFTHSVMFHHFHGGKHLPGQGSLSADDFDAMIGWLSQRHRILGADDYLQRLKSRTLRDADICLSFDDALLCQAEIAVPVLARHGITAYFFVYSSPFSGNPDPLEIYRHFRMSQFGDVDAFYTAFFAQAQALYPSEYAQGESGFDVRTYLSAFPFYTDNDRWFRFLRDRVLMKARYDAIMQAMMDEARFDVAQASQDLWMGNHHLQKLHQAGHVVGLHSYSHPTMIHQLSPAEQAQEYARNFEHLQATLGSAPYAMSHPCGNYSDSTLDILKGMGVQIGFRSSLSTSTIASDLEVPRNDHANVWKEMTQ